MHISPVKEQPQDHANTVSIPKLPILVVDDTPENLHAFTAILEKNHFNVVCVNSGMEALRYLMKHDVGLILLDVQMPELNGFETAGLIRLKEHLRETPILFISATMNTDEFVMRGFATGASDYLSKPIDSNILVHKVEIFYRLHEQNKLLLQRNTLVEDINQNLIESAEKTEGNIQSVIKQLQTLLSPTASTVSQKSNELTGLVNTPELENLAKDLLLANNSLQFLTENLSQMLTEEVSDQGEEQTFNMGVELQNLMELFQLIHAPNQLNYEHDDRVTNAEPVKGRLPLLLRLLYSLISEAMLNSTGGKASLQVSRYAKGHTYDFKLSHAQSVDLDAAKFNQQACEQMAAALGAQLSFSSGENDITTLVIELQEGES